MSAFGSKADVDHASTPDQFLTLNGSQGERALGKFLHDDSQGPAAQLFPKNYIRSVPRWSIVEHLRTS
jgi:hypothetical protein